MEIYTLYIQELGMNIRALLLKASLWSTLLSLPISILVAIKSYHNYYNFHSEQYRQAVEYLETSACTDSGRRASLGNYNLCPQSEEIIKIYPFIRSFYELGDDLWVCGRGRCWAVVEMFSTIPWFIVGVFLVSGTLFYCISERRYKDSVEYWSLPDHKKLKNK